MVIPEYQGKQIEIGLMNKLLEGINEYNKVNPDIRTYLGVSIEKEVFMKNLNLYQNQMQN